MALTNDDTTSLTQLLMPYFQDKSARQATLFSALGQSPLVMRIDVDGAPFTFTQNMINTLYGHNMDDGTPYLVALLKTVRGMGGINHYAAIDTLIARFNADVAPVGGSSGGGTGPRPLTHLTAEQRRRVVDLASDFVAQAEQRTQLVNDADWDTRLRRQVTMGGANDTFLSNLLSLAANYGTLDNERNALDTLMSAIQDRLGKAGRDEIDRMRGA